MPQGPTPKQTALATERIANPTAPLAHVVRKVYARSTSEHAARTVFEAPGTQKEIKRLMKGAKVSDSRVFKKLSGLLDATTVKAGGESGPVTVDDNPVQLKTAELFLKMRGYLKDGQDAAQVYVLVIQQIAPLIAPFVPEDQRSKFMATLEANGSNGNKGS